MELDIKRERALDSVAKRRAKGGNLGGRPRKITDGQIKVARDAVIYGGRTVTEVTENIGISRTTYYARVAELEANERAQAAIAANPEALHLLREDPQTQAARSVPRPERDSAQWRRGF